ncbi:MAG: response regulator [Cyclobacteriaceae bacterium]
MAFFKKVLLVDDDDIANILHAKTLKKHNFCEEIGTAENGEVALEAIKNPPLPNILFLDLKMPNMDGFDFLSRFESLPEDITSEIAVFVLTSSISKIDYEKVKQFKVKGYLNKPLNLEKLEEVKNKLSA